MLTDEKGENRMKKFVDPEIKVESFVCEDILTTSNEYETEIG